MANILLADNQPIIVAGLTKFLEAQEGFELSGVLDEKSDLFSYLTKYPAAILIGDPESSVLFTLETILEIRHAYPSIKILILSDEQKKSRIMEILQKGVHGFLTKDCDQPEFVNGLKTILRGERYYGQRILNLIIENSLQPEKSANKNNSALTVREAELLALIASGYSNQRAALAMNLSPHTVHTHRKKIIKKLNIKSPTEFLIHALDLGLVELPTKL